MPRVVVVCAERTGSNLLVGLLNSPPNCRIAGELFNRKMINEGNNPGIPGSWWHENKTLCLNDPTEFLRRFWRTNEERYKFVGFKLMYFHGIDFPAVLNTLHQDRSIRIIHLRRRNLLRRYLSFQLAKKNQVWAIDINAPVPPISQITIDPEDVIRDINTIKTREQNFSELFSQHQVLNLWYEDLAKAPQEIGKLALEFMGCSSQESLIVKYRKNTVESLEAVISNFNELKNRLNMYRSYFAEDC